MANADRSAVLVFAIAWLCGPIGTCAAAALDCNENATAKSNVERLDADLAQLGSATKAQESAMEQQIAAAAEALVHSGNWSQQDRAGFFAKRLKSTAFIKAEKQKQTQLALFALAAQTLVSYREKENYPQACISANDMRELLASIAAINDSQYQKLLADLQAITVRR